MGFISKNAPLFLTDGTAVDFVKTTSRGNLQVKLPDSHPFAAGQDAGRIFRANGGAHYKGHTELKLTNVASAPAAAPAPAPVAASGIDVTQPLVLSDGTAVTFVKMTPRKGFIQVKLPDSHPFAAGQENGRLFKTDGTRPTKIGSRYRTDLTLANGTASVAAAAAAAPAVAGTFAIVSATGSMLAEGLDTFDNAVTTAAGLLSDGSPLSIVEVTTKVVGTVGITVSRA